MYHRKVVSCCDSLYARVDNILNTTVQQIIIDATMVAAIGILSQDTAVVYTLYVITTLYVPSGGENEEFYAACLVDTWYILKSKLLKKTAA